MSPVLRTIAQLVLKYENYADSEEYDICQALERSIWQLCMEAVADGEVEGLEARVACEAALRTLKSARPNEEIEY
jgi:hypothetical protein